MSKTIMKTTIEDFLNFLDYTRRPITYCDIETLHRYQDIASAFSNIADWESKIKRDIVIQLERKKDHLDTQVKQLALDISKYEDKKVEAKKVCPYCNQTEYNHTQNCIQHQLYLQIQGAQMPITPAQVAFLNSPQNAQGGGIAHQFLSDPGQV